jgi:hypothetical protein
MARERVPPVVIQRQQGHTNPGITSIYLQGVDNAEIVDTCTRTSRRTSLRETLMANGIFIGLASKKSALFSQYPPAWRSIG